MASDETSAYDASERTKVTLSEAEAMVGKRVALTLTGTINEAGESAAGAYVKFQLDERWGFPGSSTFIMDADPFEVLDPAEGSDRDAGQLPARVDDLEAS